MDSPLGGREKNGSISRILSASLKRFSRSLCVQLSKSPQSRSVRLNSGSHEASGRFKSAAVSSARVYSDIKNLSKPKESSKNSSRSHLPARFAWLRPVLVRRKLAVWRFKNSGV